MITRRQFATSTPWLAAGPLALAGCSQAPAADSYEAVAASTWQLGAVTSIAGAALGQERVRCATLAPSSHNTQCWKLALGGDARSIAILPDLARRCPAVDPDDHPVFVSLGCATENLIQAALAHGLEGDAQFDPASNAVQIGLAPTRARTTPLFTAIPLRQCTRGDYDGVPLSAEDLALLQRAGSSDRVRLLFFTERSAMERTLEYVIQGNTAQMADVAFVEELKSRIRLNGTDAVCTRDGLAPARAAARLLLADIRRLLELLGTIARHQAGNPPAGHVADVCRQLRTQPGRGLRGGEHPRTCGPVRLHVAPGGTLPAAPASGYLLMTLVNFLLVLLGGPMGEEFGWRGCALPRA